MATTTVFNLWKQKGDSPEAMSGLTLKLALLASTWTPNIDTDEFWADISAHEVTNGGGYTTGGVALASLADGLDTAGDFAYLDAADPSWATLTKTFRHAVVYDATTGVAATSRLIQYTDFLVDQTVSGVPLTLTVAAPASGGLHKVA